MDLLFLFPSFLFEAQKNRPAAMHASDTLFAKNEMTLDCFIFRSSSFFTNSDHPQSRVISI